MLFRFMMYLITGATALLLVYALEYAFTRAKKPKRNKEKKTCQGCKYLVVWNDGHATCDMRLERACIPENYIFWESDSE